MKKRLLSILFILVILISGCSKNNTDLKKQETVKVESSSKQIKTLTQEEKDLLKKDFSNFTKEDRSKFLDIESKYDYLSEEEKNSIKADYDKLLDLINKKREEEKNEAALKAEEKQKAIKESKYIKVGEDTQLKNFKYKVEGVKNTNEYRKNSREVKKTNSNFTIVTLNYVNTSSKPISLHSDNINFVLIDTSKNTTYKLNDEATIELNTYCKVYEEDKCEYVFNEVNPNLEYKIKLVFEIPEQANENFILRVSSKTEEKLFKIQ